MKRQIALWLAALTLLPATAALSSCNGEENGTGIETQRETENETESETETESDAASGNETPTESETETNEVGQPVTLALEFSADRELCSTGGSIVKRNGWASTDYMDIRAYYALSYTLAAKDKAYAVSFFDADKTFISGVGVGEGNDSHVYLTTQGSVIVPEGAVYARFLNTTNEAKPMEDASVVAYPDKATYEDYLADHAWDGKKVVCIGDSLTEGDYGLQVGVANVFYRNYPFFLSQQTGATTVNWGYSGATADSYQRQWLRMAEKSVEDADVVIIMLGTNLGLTGANAIAYKTIVTKVQESMKEGATLVLVTPPHATEMAGKPNYGYNGIATTAGEFVRVYAAEAGLPLIDAYVNSPIQEENEDIYQKNDGLHMCEEGYEAFAAFMVEELRKILDK